MDNLKGRRQACLRSVGEAIFRPYPAFTCDWCANSTCLSCYSLYLRNGGGTDLNGHAIPLRGPLTKKELLSMEATSSAAIATSLQAPGSPGVNTQRRSAESDDRARGSSSSSVAASQSSPRVPDGQLLQCPRCGEGSLLFETVPLIPWICGGSDGKRSTKNAFDPVSVQKYHANKDYRKERAVSSHCIMAEVVGSSAPPAGASSRSCPQPHLARAATCHEGGSFSFRVTNYGPRQPCVWCTVSSSKANEDRSNGGPGGRLAVQSITPVQRWYAPPSLPGVEDPVFSLDVPAGLWGAPGRTHQLALYREVELYRVDFNSDGSSTMKMSETSISLPSSSVVATGQGKAPKGSPITGLAQQAMQRHQGMAGRAKGGPAVGLLLAVTVLHGMGSQQADSPDIAAAVDHLLSLSNVAVCGFGSKIDLLRAIALSSPLADRALHEIFCFAAPPAFQHNRAFAQDREQRRAQLESLMMDNSSVSHCRDEEADNRPARSTALPPFSPLRATTYHQTNMAQLLQAVGEEVGAIEMVRRYLAVANAERMLRHDRPTAARGSLHAEMGELPKRTPPREDAPEDATGHNPPNAEDDAKTPVTNTLFGSRTVLKIASNDVSASGLEAPVAVAKYLPSPSPRLPGTIPSSHFNLQAHKSPSSRAAKLGARALNFDEIEDAEAELSLGDKVSATSGTSSGKALLLATKPSLLLARDPQHDTMPPPNTTHASRALDNIISTQSPPSRQREARVSFELNAAVDLESEASPAPKQIPGAALIINRIKGRLTSQGDLSFLLSQGSQGSSIGSQNTLLMGSASASQSAGQVVAAALGSVVAPSMPEAAIDNPQSAPLLAYKDFPKLPFFGGLGQGVHWATDYAVRIKGGTVGGSAPVAVASRTIIKPAAVLAMCGIIDAPIINRKRSRSQDTTQRVNDKSYSGSQLLVLHSIDSLNADNLRTVAQLLQDNEGSLQLLCSFDDPAWLSTRSAATTTLGAQGATIGAKSEGQDGGVPHGRAAAAAASSLAVHAKMVLIPAHSKAYAFMPFILEHSHISESALLMDGGIAAFGGKAGAADLSALSNGQLSGAADSAGGVISTVPAEQRAMAETYHRALLSFPRNYLNILRPILVLQEQTVIATLNSRTGRRAEVYGNEDDGGEGETANNNNNNSRSIPKSTGKASKAHFMSVHALAPFIESRASIMMSTHKLNAVLSELKSNELAIYDSGTHSLLIPNYGLILKLLDEVEGRPQQDA